MLLSNASEFKGEERVAPIPSDDTCRAVSYPFSVKSSIGGCSQQKLLLKPTLSCIAEATVVIKIANYPDN